MFNISANICVKYSTFDFIYPCDAHISVEHSFTCAVIDLHK